MYISMQWMERERIILNHNAGFLIRGTEASCYICSRPCAVCEPCFFLSLFFGGSNLKVQQYQDFLTHHQSSICQSVNSLKDVVKSRPVCALSSSTSHGREGVKFYLPQGWHTGRNGPLPVCSPLSPLVFVFSHFVLS